MSEYKFVLFLVIAIILVVIHFLTVPNDKKSQAEQYDGLGTITRINMNENGRTWYYVDININGQVYSAQTDSYRKTPDNIDKGDTVSVKYQLNKNGYVSCYITQEGFERVIQENKKSIPVLLYAAIAAFLIFLFMLVKTMLKL